jgi:hypothetical protein
MKFTATQSWHFVLLCVSLAAPGIAFADVSEANHSINLNAPLDPVQVADVKLYTYKPTVPVKVVGTILARGMAEGEQLSSYDLGGRLLQLVDPPKVPTEQDDIDLAMKALYADAAAIGANGIIITKSVQVRVSDRATERRITAIAFRVEGQ